MVLSKGKNTAYIAALTKPADLKLYGAPILITVMTDDGWDDILSYRSTAQTMEAAISEMKAAGYIEQAAA